MLGYKNSGQGGYFGYKDKEFNTGKSIRFNKGLTAKSFILIFMLDIARDALNFAKYIVKTTTSLFRGLCRRSVLKEWYDRRRRRVLRFPFYQCKKAMIMKAEYKFYIGYRKTVDRIK